MFALQPSRRWELEFIRLETEEFQVLVYGLFWEYVLFGLC